MKERMYKSNAKVKYISNSFKQTVLDQAYATIINITDKTKERHFFKNSHLYTKFNNLKKRYH